MNPIFILSHLGPKLHHVSCIHISIALMMYKIATRGGKYADEIEAFKNSKKQTTKTSSAHAKDQENYARKT